MIEDYFGNIPSGTLPTMAFNGEQNKFNIIILHFDTAFQLLEL